MDRNTGALSRCPDARALLPAYVEGELSLAESRRVAIHLDLCADCRREEAQYRQAFGLLHAPREMPSAGDLYAGFAAKLAARESRAARFQGRLRWAGAAACLLLVAGAGATLLPGLRGGDSVPGGRPDPTRAASQPPPPSVLAEANRGKPRPPDGVNAPGVEPDPAPERTASRKEPEFDPFGPGGSAWNVLNEPKRSAAKPAPDRRPRPPRRRIHRLPVAAPERIAMASADVPRAGTRPAPDIVSAIPSGDTAFGGQPDAPAPESEAMLAIRDRAARLPDAGAPTMKMLAGKPVCMVPEMNERVQVGEKLTKIRTAAGYDRKGRRVMVNVNITTTESARPRVEGSGEPE